MHSKPTPRAMTATSGIQVRSKSVLVVKRGLTGSPFGTRSKHRLLAPRPWPHPIQIVDGHVPNRHMTVKTIGMGPERQHQACAHLHLTVPSGVTLLFAGAFSIVRCGEVGWPGSLR